MQALRTLRLIGEVAARNRIGSADDYFDDLVKEMYPKNLHRRAWAWDNLHLFYSNEKERMLIMQRLTSEKDAKPEPRIPERSKNVFR